MIWYTLYILESLLLFRFVLRLMGANPEAVFTQVLYGVTSIPLAPFLFVFKTDSLGTSVLEWSTLLAMFVYWFIAIAAVRLLSMGRSVTDAEAEQEIRSQENI